MFVRRLAREFCQRLVAAHVSETAALGRRAIRKTHPFFFMYVEIADEQGAHAASAMADELRLERVDRCRFASARWSVAEACDKRPSI